jgi:peptidoglycan-associated lipoprotein
MIGHQLRHLVLGCLVAAGCAKKTITKLPEIPASTASQPVAAAPPPANVSASPHVTVSDDLAKQCELHLASQKDAPKFDYDQAELLPDDRKVLEQIAECVTRGPLHGKSVELVGRSDPRGTDEYNLGLGTRRAETVSNYLQRLGVPPRQLTATTRGDLDALGKDEIGWRDDRRVDLQLRK